MSFENPLKGFNASSEQLKTPSFNDRKELEHSRDIFDFKMLQLAISTSKAEGKTLKETLTDDERTRLNELTARISTEERISIMAEVNAMLERNKMTQNKEASSEAFTVCRECGKRVKVGKFCEQCGKSIELSEKGKSILEADENKFFCMSCGKIAKPGKFCGNCGGRIFNGAERALFRIMDIDVNYPAQHPAETLKIIKAKRNAYIKDRYQGETGHYKNEAEVKKILEVYNGLIEKLS